MVTGPDPEEAAAAEKPVRGRVREPGTCAQRPGAVAVAVAAVRNGAVGWAGGEPRGRPACEGPGPGGAAMSCPGPGPQAPAASASGPSRQPRPPSPAPALGLLGIGPAPVLTAPPAAPAGAPELQKRVVDLEKSLQFVQQQHADTLLSLHAEVERLRRDNRDLHYKLIMNQKLPRKGMASSSSHFLKSNSVVVPSGCSASKTKHSLSCPRRQEVGESGEEEQSPSDKMEKGPAGQARDGRNRRSLQRGRARSDTSSKASEAPGRLSERTGNTPLVGCPCSRAEEMEAPSSTLIPMVSCQPQLKHILGITSSLKLPPHMRKLSTLQQCELVIRQLWNANHLQAQELQHLKSVLEDGSRQAADSLPVNHSKRALGEKNKTMPVSVCSLQGPVPGQTFSPLRHQEGMQFPKVADKNASKKCLILAPIPGAERAVLPALKQTLRNSFAERQKKMQAIQSRRLHRTVL
ncbi:coiled-coil domain-containing protein 74B-like [Dromiciops gliroides]|uniref:coiled-coil domain-containing protein 74B-like n=1 Tax=Dromiciops gliroides TaxID=33562 RepID=UPI001CC40682|nr:coiled-coil domain-containing protein 74B-like [Dromiciops gliroides]